MAKITNKGVNSLLLPDGTALPLGETVEVEGWEELKKHHHVAALVEQDVLRVGADRTDSKAQADKK